MRREGGEEGAREAEKEINEWGEDGRKLQMTVAGTGVGSVEKEGEDGRKLQMAVGGTGVGSVEKEGEDGEEWYPRLHKLNIGA